MNSSADSGNRRRIAGERRRKNTTAHPSREAVAPATPDADDTDLTDSNGGAVASPQVRQPSTSTSTSAQASVVATERVTSVTPADSSSLPESDTGPEVAAAESPTSRRGFRIAIAALIASLLLLGTLAGIVFRSPGPSASDATAAVATARTSLAALLSFDAKTVANQPKTVGPLLTDSFRTEYTETMTKNIAPLAVKNGSIVKASVMEIGVQSQTDTTVTVQAFVNQSRTSTAEPNAAIDQNRVIATMTKANGRWLISKLAAY